jgi:hypothetical protein
MHLSAVSDAHDQHMVSKRKEMIRVPVVNGFIYDAPIGTLTIDETQLPIDRKFCFTIIMDESTKELLAVAIAKDDSYHQYLHSVERGENC